VGLKRSAGVLSGWTPGNAAGKAPVSRRRPGTDTISNHERVRRVFLPEEHPDDGFARARETGRWKATGTQVPFREEDRDAKADRAMPVQPLPKPAPGLANADASL